LFFQAAIIARKKEAAAETLHKVREELSQANIEVEEKRGLAKQGDGEEILKGEEVRIIIESYTCEKLLLVIVCAN